MDMITVEQIKAARGLLNWTQADLAKATGISLTALNNIERKSVLPRMGTLELIRQAIIGAGVEFTDGPGVRLSGEFFEFHKFEGKGFIDEHTKDIIASTEKGDFIYYCAWDEQKIVQHSSDKDAAYQRHVKTNRIDERILIPEGDHFFIGRPEVYRWLSRSALGRLHWLVYGNKVAFYLWDKPYRAITIHNPTLAEAYKNQFLFMWNIATPIPDDVIQSRK